MNEVRDAGPADKAGLRENDIITGFDGQAVRDANDAARLTSRARPGERVELEVWRRGKSVKINVTLEAAQ